MIEAFDILEFETLESTQTYAKELLNRGNLKHGQVIIANNQLAGYGRNEKKWISSQDNIAITIAIRLDIPQELWPQVSYVAGISVLKTIQSFHEALDIKLKWVNDVLLKGKKVAGILLEKQQHNFLLIGIGVNIKANKEILSLNASSLEDFDINTNQKDFTSKLLSSFKTLYNTWHTFGFAQIRNLWLDKAYGISQTAKVTFANKPQFEGIFLDINETGEAVFLSNNKIITINAGEVYL